MSELISPVDGRTGRVAAIYARVSSERQRQDETIQSQTVGLRELAAARGLLVCEDLVFEDEGFSGATLQRPALERLRDRAAEAAFEVLLCHAPDRLARRYAYQVLLLEEFARVGVEVCFAKEPERGATPEDELLRQFQGMIAEYERAQIAERTRRGKLHRARGGEQLSNVVDLAMKDDQAATFSSWVVVSSWVSFIPSLNFTPVSTSLTSSWPLIRRQRSWADSSSL